jgi:hypothetical protein
VKRTYRQFTREGGLARWRVLDDDGQTVIADGLLSNEAAREKQVELYPDAGVSSDTSARWPLTMASPDAYVSPGSREVAERLWDHHFAD